MLRIRTKISRLPLVIIVLLLIALFYGLSVRPVERLPWHQQILFAILTPFQKSIKFVGREIVDIWDHYFNLVKVSRDNDRLREIVDEQNFELNRLREVRTENRRLRMLMGFKDQHALDIVGAEVIANDPRSDFRVITINKGSEQGLSAYMPVIAASGLAGRVADVSDDISRVLLITDPNSAVDVLVQRSRARALLVGTKAKAELRSHHYLSKLEYLNRKSDIMNGDVVVTSGLDGVYPPGIPVGIVSDMEYAPQGVFRDALVIPFVDFSNLEEVLVVVR